MIILSGSNLKRAKIARKRGIKDMFLTPVIDGKVVVLHYKHGLLESGGFTAAQQKILDRSNVPTSIVTERGTFGGLRIKKILVLGKVVKYSADGKLYFVAEDLDTPEGSNPFNRILRLNLLHMQGFRTVLPLCSWLAVPSFTRKEAEKRLQQRLQEIREVADGYREAYWKSSTLYRKKQPTPISGSMVKSLELHHSLLEAVSQGEASEKGGTHVVHTRSDRRKRRTAGNGLFSQRDR